MAASTEADPGFKTNKTVRENIVRVSVQFYHGLYNSVTAQAKLPESCTSTELYKEISSL